MSTVAFTQLRSLRKDVWTVDIIGHKDVMSLLKSSLLQIQVELLCRLNLSHYAIFSFTIILLTNETF